MKRQQKITQPYSVWCANCGRKLKCEGETSAEVVTYARGYGWIIGTQNWLCPRCAARSADGYDVR